MLKERVKEKLQASDAPSRGGSSGECGAGSHRHPDAYQDKCHNINQKHKRTQIGLNDDSIGKITEKLKKIKPLKPVI